MTNQMFELTTKPKHFDYLLTYRNSLRILNFYFHVYVPLEHFSFYEKCKCEMLSPHQRMRTVFILLQAPVILFPSFTQESTRRKPVTKNKEGSLNSSEENKISLANKRFAFHENSEFIQNVLFYISGYIV